MVGVDLVSFRTRVSTIVVLLVEGLNPFVRILHLIGGILVGHNATCNIVNKASRCHWRRLDCGSRNEEADEKVKKAHVVDC